MSLPSAIDVAIIGAGAAGIGAARALEGKGLSVIMLEARDRLGGRAYTQQLSNGIIFDLGCHWLHSADRNKFVPIAEKLGFDIDRGRPHWSQQTFNIGFPQDERIAYLKEMDAFYDRAEAAAEDGPDRPASELLLPGNRWNAMLNCVSTYINGVELDRVSIYDMDTYEDTEFNWRVKRGYGVLVAAYGAPCPVAFDTRVTLIDHSSARIRIVTSRGTLTAGKVVVTVPTNLIANESLRFFPALPEKIEAARGLPLGLADNAGARQRRRRTAERRPPARLDHQSRHRQLSPAPAGLFQHRRLFRRKLCARAGRCRRRRLRSRRHRRNRRPARLRLSQEAAAARRVTLGTRPVRHRLLLPRPARPRR
jgi:monoamine oxidase